MEKDKTVFIVHLSCTKMIHWSVLRMTSSSVIVMDRVFHNATIKDQLWS